MKNVYKQFLLLAGFYFIISLFIGHFENEVFELINIGLLIIFIIMFITLIFKKSFSFLEKFQSRYTKSSNYLYALGFVKYLQIIFLEIIGGIDGYHAAMAQYENVEYISPYTDLLTLIALSLLLVFVIALLWATYVNFIKPIIKRKQNEK